MSRMQAEKHALEMAKDSGEKCLWCSQMAKPRFKNEQQCPLQWLELHCNHGPYVPHDLHFELLMTTDWYLTCILLFECFCGCLLPFHSCLSTIWRPDEVPGKGTGHSACGTTDRQDPLETGRENSGRLWCWHPLWTPYIYSCCYVTFQAGQFHPINLKKS